MVSWLPPFFECGVCGGEIGRWPSVNLLKQEVALWRHRTVPDAWQDTPHQAVLGTPAHTPDIRDTPKKGSQRDTELDGPEIPPNPIVPARPALAGDLPASAARLDKKAAENGWEVEAFYMVGPLMNAQWKFSRWVQSVVLRLERDGHRLVAVWQAPYFDTPEEEPEEPAWKFESAYSLTHYVDPISSPELNAAVTTPRALCESCDEPPALHASTNTGPVCHNEWITQRQKGA